MINKNIDEEFEKGGDSPSEIQNKALEQCDKLIELLQKKRQMILEGDDKSIVVLVAADSVDEQDKTTIGGMMIGTQMEQAQLMARLIKIGLLASGKMGL